MVASDLERAKQRFLGGDGDASVCKSDAIQTEAEWAYILALCQLKYPIGFGALDSFLSGPDLDRRISLVEVEAASNEWLRCELCDTLGLNQRNNWTAAQFQRLSRCAPKTK